MKLSKTNLLFLLIIILIFFIPFFWFKPGEMDLGGDSSRLYFYDPLSYLPNQSLYGVIISDIGQGNLSFFGIPFILLLALLKSFLVTPTLLISVFHGLSLSLGFVFVYLTVRELLKNTKQFSQKDTLVKVSAITAGLCYVFSPAEIHDWRFVIVTHNQIFLNPMMFYIILRFFMTQRMKYIYTALLLSFIFAPNFSFIAAPPIFSFYPIALFFVVSYTVVICKKKPPFKKILIGFLLFLLIQGFHLIPQITDFAPGGHLYTLVSSKEAKLDRGLSYFNAIAPQVKVSIDLLGLPQLTDLPDYKFLFFLFPFVIFFGFLINKSKTYLLTGFVFFFCLLFAAANITNGWLYIYKALFNVPGFSMFRNFYGQWQYTLLFFFAIFFGQGLASVLLFINKRLINASLILGITILLICNAWPFINGTFANDIHWTSKGKRPIVQMDPLYEKFLQKIKDLPIDGKVLILPLNDHGSQALAGINGGVYQGPSTISYLGGKKDFSGYEQFGEYRDDFTELVKNQDFKGLQHLFAILNIKYVVYNSDTNIYDDNFPNFPYGYVRKIMPAWQSGYKTFIPKLGLEQKINMGNKYYLYEIKNKDYLPHIYIPGKIWYFDEQITNGKYPLSLVAQDNRIAFYNQALNKPNIADETYFVPVSTRSFIDTFQIQNALKLLSIPFISQRLSSPIYPFVAWREQQTLEKYPAVSDEYIEKSIYFLEKRILELQRWENDGGILIMGNVQSIDSVSSSWKDLSPWRVYTNAPYNYWEVGLGRYQNAAKVLINKINTQNNSTKSSFVYKTEIKEIMNKHKFLLTSTIEGGQKPIEEKLYLLKLTNELFDTLNEDLMLNDVFPDKTTYTITNLPNGIFYPMLDKNDLKNVDFGKVSVTDTRNYYPLSTQADNRWIQFDPITNKKIKTSTITLSTSEVIPNLATTSARLLEKLVIGNPSMSLHVIGTTSSDTSGFVADFSGWYPNTQYILSFDYLTYGKKFKLGIFENQGNEEKRINIFNEDISSTKWQKFKRIIGLSTTDPSNFAYSAYLQIQKQEDDLLGKSYGDEKNSKIEVKNLSVVQVLNPKILLKKVEHNDINRQPKIVFTKINPTRYSVKVTGAVRPYMLVLSDAFNPYWNLVDISRPNDSVPDSLARGVGSISQFLLWHFLPDAKKPNGITESYFGGSIQQTKSTDMFLDKKTVDTWGKKTIANDRHYLVNNYANGWYILPGDMNGKKDYTIVVEMGRQTQFYMSMMLSLTIVSVVLTLLIYSLYKENRHGKSI